MTNPYIERLYNEWCEHERIIIAVDFDDTLVPHKGIVPDYSGRVIKLLKECQKAGCCLIINTAAGTSRYPEMVAICHEKGIDVDGINFNPIPLPYGNNGKVYANIYLDDRAGLLEALDILEEALDLYLKYKKLKNGHQPSLFM